MSTKSKKEKKIEEQGEVRKKLVDSSLILCVHPAFSELYKDISLLAWSVSRVVGILG
jgi:hypothetical protein